MGILDDAIRDHLDLKRRRGTDEPELKRLEDEAFGPPGRPDTSGADAAIASALATPSAETAVGGEPGLEPAEAVAKPNGDAGQPPVAETQTPDAPAPEAPPAPQPETGDDDGEGESGGETEPPGTSGGVAFHDFAAEQGLLESAPEPDLEAPLPGEQVPSEPAPPESPAAEEPPAEPAQEPHAPEAEDTQVHDMERELGIAGDATIEQPDQPAASPPAETASEGEELGGMELEELDIELDEEKLELPSEDLEAEELEIPEPGDEEGDDVLEETPEFLRDTPESDRLWFEQGHPKDFDFDEDE